MKTLFPKKVGALNRAKAEFHAGKDFLVFRLTGERVTDPSDASEVLGMDLHTQNWDTEFLKDLSLERSKFPEIVPTASVCGRVTAEAARLTGVAQGTPVVIGSGDLASAAVGGGVDQDTFSLTLGTAGQLLGAGAKGTGAQLAEKLFLFAHADPECELYLGSVPSGGFSFEWFARLHNIGMAQFFELSASVPLSAELCRAAVIGAVALRQYENIRAASSVMIRKQEQEFAPSPAAQALYGRFLNLTKPGFSPDSPTRFKQQNTKGQSV